MPNMLQVEVNGTSASRSSTDLVSPQAGRVANGEMDALAIANLPFAEELYFQYLRDPQSVDPEWRALFAALDGGATRNGAGPAALVPPAAFQRSIYAERYDGPPPSAPGAI